jgi:hypothetical protein
LRCGDVKKGSRSVSGGSGPIRTQIPSSGAPSSCASTVTISAARSTTLVEDVATARANSAGIDARSPSGLDAAAEGARFGALADNGPADGVERTVELISEAIGPGFARDVRVSQGEWMGYPALTVTVRTALPLLGPIGIDGTLEVSGHAAIETLD